MTPEEFSEIKTDVIMIKRDVSQIEKCLSNLDKSMNDLSVITRQIAVQEKTIEHLEKRLSRLENQTNNASSINDDFRREFNERQELFRRDFNDRFDAFTISFEQKKNEEHNQILEHIRELTKELRDKDRSQDAQIDDINKWKWYAIGGVVTLSSIISLTWKTFFG